MINNINAEQSLLGSILIEPSIIAQVAQLIKDKRYFYDIKNQVLWEQLCVLINKNIPIDFVTLAQEGMNNNYQQKIELSYITSLTDKTPTSAHWKSYVEIVAECWRSRKLIKECILSKQALEKKESSFKVWKNMADKMPKIFLESEDEYCVHDLIDELHEIEQGKRKWGMSWNYEPLDSKLGVFEPGTIHIIAGRPGHGKTTLAVHLAEAWAEKKIKVLYESLEMHKRDLDKRRISNKTGISLYNLKQGNINNKWDLIHNAAAKIYEMNKYLYVNDKKYKTPDDIALDIKIAHDLYGIKIFILDHWHRIIFPHTGDNYIHRGEEGFEKIISTCTNLKVTPIILSQLNREGERRDVKDKLPILSDIRDLNRIVEAADTVMFLHWNFKNTNESADKFNLLLRIAKCRDGKTGDSKIEFVPSIFKIGNEIYT